MSLKRLELLGTRLVTENPALYNIGRTIIGLYDSLLLKYSDLTKKPLVIVYQQGRVASTSVYEALVKKGLNLPVFHLHHLSSMEFEENGKFQDTARLGTHRNHDLSIKVVRSLKKRERSKCKFPKSMIISIYRDPLEIMLSLIMMHESDQVQNNQSSHREYLLKLQDQINREDPTNWKVCNWFYDTFSKETGIEIYNNPIDHDKGYTLIEGIHYRAVIFDFSMINMCFQDGICELLNRDIRPLSIDHSNIHRNKSIDDLQYYVKRNFRASREFCEKLFSSQFMKHFYSDGQRAKMRERWSDK